MVIWIIGLSGAGKTSMAEEIEKQVRSKVPNIVFIDGEDIREELGGTYGYRTNDRNVILEKTIQMARECNSNIERVFCGWDEGTLLKSL